MIKKARIAAAALTLLATLAGCGSDAPNESDVWGDPEAPAAAGTLGPGSECPDAPTLSIPAGWEPWTRTDEEPLVAYGIKLICSVDGLSAGVRGRLELSTAPTASGDPRATIERYLTDWPDEPKEFRSIADGVEVRWRINGDKHRIFATAGGDTTYLIRVQTGRDEVFERALPAFVLFRESLASIA